MSLRASIFDIRLIKIISLFVIYLHSTLLFAGGETKTQNQKIDKQYKMFLVEEKKNQGNLKFAESLAGGIVALTVGLYGYYTDDNPLAKLVYSTTQTAGVLLISDSILTAHKPSIFLLTEKHFQNNDVMNRNDYQRLVVYSENKRRIAEYTQLAYSTGILSLLYGYNGYRENIKSVSNVMFFLSGNFLLISISNFYKSKQFKERFELGILEAKGNTRLAIKILPYPQLTYYF